MVDARSEETWKSWGMEAMQLLSGWGKAAGVVTAAKTKCATTFERCFKSVKTDLVQLRSRAQLWSDAFEQIHTQNQSRRR